MLTVPDAAIACFEHFSRTKVSCYPYSPLFTATISMRIHRFLPCGETKQTLHRECMSFDSRNAPRTAWNYPDGGIKICHAGLLEWFVPVIQDQQLLCFLTAGVRRPPPQLPETLPLLATPTLLSPKTAANVPETSVEEVQSVLELMRMLAARLGSWHRDMMAADFHESDLPRAEIIRGLIGREGHNGLTLDALARMLHLSPSRTAHLVREETGQSFSELMLRSRTGFATTLLVNTGLPVAEVARRCGFGSTAQFHRAFRRQFAITPLAYRKQFQTRGA